MLGVIEDPEVLLFICGFLEPKELSRLAGVSRGFGRKTQWAALEGGEPEMRSLVEESARRWVLARRPPGGVAELAAADELVAKEAV